MLDRTVFMREMALLEERFARQHSAPVLARYYETLGARLTTEQFATAARQVFDRDTFWPAPQRFIDLALGSTRGRAREEWQAIMRSFKDVAGLRPQLSAAARAALDAAGGWHAVGTADMTYALPRLERAFLESYVEAEERDGVAALPSGRAELTA